MKLVQENLPEKKKAAYISLFVGIGMFIFKMSAYLITGSNAIFSDAAESVVHVMATSMALYSIYLSAQPADESHLYGHGKIEYLSAGVEGFLILTAAITIIYFSLLSLINGVKIEKLDIGTYIIAAAGIINLFLGYYLIAKGKKTKSLILTADGKHVLTDSFTSIGVVVGLVVVMLTGYQIIDPIFAIIVALNILYTGYKLMRESIGGIMNETDPETLQIILDTINRIKKDYWMDIHHLRFWKSAETLFLDFHMILPYYFSIKQSHLEEEFIEAEFKKLFPNFSVRIHMDYCKPEVCKYCNVDNCVYRTEAKAIDFAWDAKKLIGDPVYKVAD